MKKDEVAIVIVSGIFLFYTILAAFEILTSLVFLIFSLSPLLVIWMVYVVLRHGEYNREELKEGQEFGYLDKPNLNGSTTKESIE
ncbi:MAG TPA: hypothetical protein VJ911_03015 [Cryomorphaceae bacterium]|nr:hypothetical protein [Cryomorphaceae bacterium]